MSDVLYFIGLLLVAGWIFCLYLPFYFMYRLVKELAQLHSEVEKEDEGN